MPSKPKSFDAPYLEGETAPVMSDRPQHNAPESKELNYDLFKPGNKPASMRKSNTEERSNGEIVLYILLGCIAAGVVMSFASNVIIGFGAATSLFVVLLLVFIAVKR